MAAYYCRAFMTGSKCYVCYKMPAICNLRYFSIFVPIASCWG